MAKNIEKSMVLASKFASHDLKFKVYLPDGYKGDSDERYPVFYTTAGGSRINVLKEQLAWLSHVGFGALPKVIIVTVPYIEVETDMEPKYISASGINSDLTIEVLNHEVMPYINKNFQTHPFNILEGFSSSGNFPLYVLAAKPELFNAYISVSPALVLDKSGLLAKFDKRLTSDIYKNKSLYLSLGSFTNNAPLFEGVEKALNYYANNEFNWHTEDFRTDNYMTQPMIGVSLAVQRLFSDRNPKDMAQFKTSGVKGILAYYNKLKVKYGYALSSTNALMDLSYMQIEGDQYDEAIKTLELVVNQSPENTYYLTRLASAQLEAKQNKAAKKTYNKALILAKAKGDEESIQFIQNKLKVLKL
ncbi:alpha/beta hydrolase-fold protein [Pseudoalteromonas sp. NBT06-2]|uniref:alpha/beta hydrolase-fold protein n=1 Tax=Pseudoalteromonas sp. NBT06-2 TaxID=2025950 RepID=UPI0014823FE8|nr:alpha/beta hydrolase-fold protein [Pseudoalteromonas sp. NBT06-2]